MQKYSVLTVLALCAVLCVFPVKTTAAAGEYSLFGDVILVPPGSGSPMAAQVASDATVSPGYGGVDFAVPTGTTFADLQTLSTDFNVTDDDCRGGSPRFQINVDTGSGIKNIFAYIGPQPNYTGCIPNTWTNSGDLLDTSRSIDTSQLPGGTFYDTYAHASLAYGNYPVVGIQLVVDSSWAFADQDQEQTILVDNVMINDTRYTFETPDSCKKGGWQQFTSAPGPFKNQGQCVSYFEHQK